MDKYINEDSIVEAIDYFKKAPISEDSMLFMYLITKQLGITNQSSVTFLSRNFKSSEGTQILNSVLKFGGIIDRTESFEKCTIIFPNGFNKGGFYQPKTNFKSLVGRMKDTIDNKNTLVGLFNNDSNHLTLNRDSMRIISDEYLNGTKISLRNLTAWLFRFDKFVFNTEPTITEFNRVLRKKVMTYLKISPRDFEWLFEDDFDTNLISFSNSATSGDTIRNHLGVNEEVREINDNNLSNEEVSLDVDSSPVVPSEEIEEYIELKGDNPSIDEIKHVLFENKQVILTGVPGTGKTRLTKQLSNEFDESTIIQFHANTSYTEFIGGETLDNSTNGATSITTKKGKFLEFIEKAKLKSREKFLFIIDEINRGDISGIFGETIITLDREYSVELIKPIEKISHFSIPDNVYILGTMNSSDRNIAFLDLALRRRFSFIEIFPNYDYLTEVIRLDIDTWEGQKRYNLGGILRVINKRIEETLNDKDKVLGQSYFIPANGTTWDIDSFKRQFNFTILPTLYEYGHQKSNAVASIVGENLSSPIHDTDMFLRSFIDNYSELVQ